MSIKRLLSAVSIASLSIFPITTATAQPADPRVTNQGEIVVSMFTPPSVPGLVQLDGEINDFYASKHPFGTLKMHTVKVDEGTYTIAPQSVFEGDTRYDGESSVQTVDVKPGSRTYVKVTYAKGESAQRPRISAVTDDSISLSWDGNDTPPAAIRRYENDSAGTAAVASLNTGVAIANDGDSITDDVEPGVSYTYAIWPGVRENRMADGRSAWEDNEPVLLTVGLADEKKPGTPTFASRPNSLVASDSDVLAAEPTGKGVRVVTNGHYAVPAPGTIISLPVSADLPGGFLGKVKDVSTDGHSLNLVPAGIADGFHLYDLSVADMSVFATQAIATPKQQSSIDAHTLPAEARIAGDAGIATWPKPSCDTFDKADVDFVPEIIPGGYADVTYDTFDLLGTPVVTGAVFDVESTVTLKGSINARFEGRAACNLNLPDVMVPFAVGPVPMAFTVSPEAQLKASGVLDVRNVGAQVTTGYRVNGELGIGRWPKLDGELINTFEVLEPTAEATRARLDTSVGVAAMIGPSIGTPDAGVKVGIGGELILMDSRLDVTVKSPATACINGRYGGEAAVVVMAKAWLGELSFGDTWRVPGLHTKWEYPQSPYTWPADC